MIIGMKSLNEEKSINLVIGDIHEETWVDKIIVIDGDSSDDTVIELKKFDKVKMYSHKWEKWYHNQECSQSNILLSYISNGEIVFLLDFDERISPELKQLLSEINKKGMPTDCASVSRKSYELMRYPNSPYAMKDKTGWWRTSKAYGQYPDYQLRVIKKKVGMHWINSPHHSLFGAGSLFTHTNLDADIIHYHGKEDERNRFNIERQWARNQSRRKELGLICDVFEADLSPEMIQYGNPKFWKEN